MMPATVTATAVTTAAPVRRLRLAVVCHGLPVEGQRRGGVERVAHALADGLGRRGHLVTVFSHDPAPAGAAYDARRLPGGRFVHSRVGRLLTMGYLGHVFAAWPAYGAFDAIVAHGDSLLLPLRRRPVVRVMHGTALEEARSASSIVRALTQLGVYVLELASAAWSDAAIGVSENTRRGNPLVRRVIPNGVDLERFHPGVKSLAPSILFVGALGGRKRGRWLIEHFQRTIRPRVPDAQLWMVSEPGLASPGVVYHRAPTDDALAVLYRRAWVYASPSVYEGFGLPCLEAMASGTPVVATPNPGSREVLDGGRFGLLADDGAFAVTVCGLLEDGPSRRRWARLGLTRASELDIRHTVLAYEHLLAGLVNAR